MVVLEGILPRDYVYCSKFCYFVLRSLYIYIYPFFLMYVLFRLMKILFLLQNSQIMNNDLWIIAYKNISEQLV